MSSCESSVEVIHKSLEEIKRLQESNAGITALTPIPAYHLYKVAREEELLSYRSVCRVLAMHYGTLGDSSLLSPSHSGGPTEKGIGGPLPASPSLQNSSCLPKVARRLLEDLQELLCITDERAKAEHIMTISDPVVRGVYHSHVLQRRENFFDGVDDVSLTTEMEDQREGGSATRAAGAEDDGYGLYMVEKRPRMEWNQLESDESKKVNGRGGVIEKTESSFSKPISTVGPIPTSNFVGNRGNGRRKGHANLAAQLSRLHREVQAAAHNFIYSTDSITQQEASKVLDVKREELLKLREELLE